MSFYFNGVCAIAAIDCCNGVEKQIAEYFEKQKKGVAK